jgi:1-acyl-sn-glycerol-3-phosphate acyltransferase
MSQHSQLTLLKQRRFLPYFITQFLGAFNDNVYKNALVILIAFQATQQSFDSNTLINLSAGLFILPFFLFSAMAGQLADKYEKSHLMQWIKIFEISIMLFATIGFYYHDLTILFVALFLMGFHSTLFGPAKYGFLPQHLRQEELMGGNGLVEMGTFLAILLGTLLGGVLIGLPNGGLWVSFVTIVIAISGYFSARSIPISPSVDPHLKINWNIFSETWQILKFTRENYTVFQSILAISWFWFFGALFLAQFPNYSKVYLYGDEHVVTLLLALFSFGVGIGSLLCERLSGHRVDIGLVPFGAIGLTIFSFDLSFAHIAQTNSILSVGEFWATSGSLRIILDIVFIGIFGGIFIVPLYTLVQQRSEQSHLSRIIAGNNIINAVFMVASAIMAILLLNAGLTIPQLFLVCALMNAAVAIYIFTLVPEFLMRFLVWIVIHLIYRIEKEGLDNVPENGAAILTCNHVSYFDPLLIAGCVFRPVRFVAYYKLFDVPLLSFVLKTAGAIPIAGIKENPQILDQAWKSMDAALKNGELICIFPEGGITRNGEMQPFRKGIEQMLKDNPVPVIPMALCGLWGTFFSRFGGKAMSHFPRHLWAKLGLKISNPIPPDQVKATLLFEKTLELRGDWK